MPTAFAMAMDMPVSEVIKFIGHDGSEILFPSHHDPYCRRSFHIQEMYDMCISNGIAVTPIELKPVGYVDIHTIEYIDLGGWPRFHKYLDTQIGVLTGVTVFDKPHAVAWDKQNVYDPNGSMYQLCSNFMPDMFYVCSKF